MLLLILNGPSANLLSVKGSRAGLLYPLQCWGNGDSRALHHPLPFPLQSSRLSCRSVWLNQQTQAHVKVSALQAYGAQCCLSVQKVSVMLHACCQACTLSTSVSCWKYKSIAEHGKKKIFPKLYLFTLNTHYHLNIISLEVI